jgi:hypothetical protein
VKPNPENDDPGSAFFTLIHTTNGIAGDFGTVLVGGNPMASSDWTLANFMTAAPQKDSAVRSYEGGLSR